MFSDDTPGDNKLKVIVQFILQNGSFGDGVSKIFKVPGLWLQAPDKTYKNILSGEWIFDLERYGVSGSINTNE
jgi:hypothetical protein